MDSADRQFLTNVIAVALACAPRAIKRAFADRTDEKHQEASRALSEAAAESVARCFEMWRKPDNLGPGAHTSHLRAAERKSG